MLTLGAAPRRGWAGRAAAALLGFVLLAGAEGVLRLAGVPPLSTEDRFVGFEGSRPVFDRAFRDGHAFRVVSPVKEPYFNTAPFEDPKPAGVFRMAFFGGSTTYGHPYLGTTSFARWTAALLGRSDPGRTYEDVNAGAISYASYRVLRVMDEVSRFAPDLYVVLSGHNEFLEWRTFEGLRTEAPGLRGLRVWLHRSSLYSALFRGIQKLHPAGGGGGRTILGDGVEAVLEKVGGPDLYHRNDAFRAGVIRQYRENLVRMVDLARDRGIPLILCTLPMNLAGVSPFKSEHAAGLSAERRVLWEREFRAGEGALVDGDARRAMACFARAEGLDDRFAMLHYRKGQALLGLGEAHAAYAAFERAKEEDIVPLRALTAMNEAIREVGRTRGVPLADMEALFRDLSSSGVPGNDWFVDHVHPTLEGQQRMAQVVVDTAVHAGLVPLGPDAWEQRREEGRAFLRQELAAVPPRYRAMGYWVVGRTYFWAGKDDEAYEALAEAWRTVRNIAEIPYRLGEIELKRGRPQTALEYLAEAEALAPADPVIDLTPQVLLCSARAYLALGRPEEAQKRLKPLNAMGKGNTADYLVAQARTLHALGRQDEAFASLAEAERVARSIPGFLAQIAGAYRALGRPDEAAARYREYLVFTRNPDPDAVLADWEGRLGVWP